MWIIYLVLGFAILYAGLVSVVALSQTKLLFPARLAASYRPALPPSAQRLELKTADGGHLIGVRFGGASDAKPVLLGFGGNAWNAESTAIRLRELFPDREIVAFHYRGYPPSSGNPSAKALLADSLAIFDDLQRPQPRVVVAIGFSIGTGVAAYLARHRSLRGLILITPFDSLEALAKQHFRWAPTGLLLRHHMHTIDLVQGRNTPTALIMAGRDTIIPASRSEPLRAAVPNLVLDRTIADAGHNDLYGLPAFAAAMHEALRRIEAEDQ
jgi:pimeloyl-ACP methyl ester carboxylesterase